MRFLGKVVIVTGGTDGIGLATAIRFKNEGAIVVVCSRKSEAVEKTKNVYGFDGVVCNVSSEEDRQGLFKHVKDTYGRVNVLVLNAATSLSFGLSIDCEETRWDKMMDTNLKSNWMMSKIMIPLMCPGNASIVIISSYAGYNPDTPIGVYGVTKTALIGLIRLLANEYGRTYNVRVNGVAPGVIETKFSKTLWESKEIRSINEKSTALGRIGHVDEVAGPILFLASQDASYITGEVIMVTGGIPSRL